MTNHAHNNLKWLWVTVFSVFLGVFYVASNVAVGQDIDNGSGSTVEMNVTCPMDLNCTDLPGDCLDCSFNESCVYGQMDNVTCRPLDHVMCEVRSCLDT